MTVDMLALAWIVVAVSHVFNTIAVLWLLRRVTRKVTIHFKRIGSDELPDGIVEAEEEAPR